MIAPFGYPCGHAQTILFLHLLTTDTTDVQDAHLIVDRSRNSMEVNCSFMASSSALGCVFELNGEFTYISIEEARYRFSVEGSLDDLIFSVYDWEHDGSMGRQPVPVCVHETTLNPATSPATGVPTGGTSLGVREGRGGEGRGGRGGEGRGGEGRGGEGRGGEGRGGEGRGGEGRGGEGRGGEGRGGVGWGGVGWGGVGWVGGWVGGWVSEGGSDACLLLHHQTTTHRNSGSH